MFNKGDQLKLVTESRYLTHAYVITFYFIQILLSSNYTDNGSGTSYILTKVFFLAYRSLKT